MTASPKNARSALSLLGDGLAQIGDPELLQHFKTVSETMESLAASVDAFEAEKQTSPAGSLAVRIATPGARAELKISNLIQRISNAQLALLKSPMGRLDQRG